jgi:Cu/Ag efflux protein CusF
MRIWRTWNVSHGTCARHDIARWRLACVVGLVVYTGCAAYSPPPLSTEHPAHPEAMAAPEPPRSTTLAYGPADRPSPQPASAMAAHGMSHGAHAAAQERPTSVVGEGTVIAVVPGSSQLVVDHQEIIGFMGAMTMGYTIHPPSLLDPLKAGDLIRFTIDTQQNAITPIEKRKE